MDVISNPIEGNALVYCEGAFHTTYGKTAHGLVRYTRRYKVVGVIDSGCAGQDAGELLDGKRAGIPIFTDLGKALTTLAGSDEAPTHWVMGVAPDGGRLDLQTRTAMAAAIQSGLHVDSGLHQFVGEDPELAAMAASHQVHLRDIRRPPDRGQLHFFSGKIESVMAFRIAVLGTDSAIGKRTTAWRIVHGLEAHGKTAELVGTGQTAWLQGARYTICLDALVNDFVAGEIEHAVWSAWKEGGADAIVIEGQGSLLNPAYPGGYEILAAAKPHVIVLQHAPARKAYDGFPAYPLHPLTEQIDIIERISGRPVVAVTLNHENLKPSEVPVVCRTTAQITGRPTYDLLLESPDRLVAQLLNYENA
jgi:uncharacterized NAD-dependent epimerase/dehydratase family protein